MAKFLALSLISVVMAVDSEVEIRMAYMNFVAIFGKSYASKNQLEDRYKVFKQNYLQV